MHFAHPEILYGVFALPLLLVFFWWSQRRRRRLLERFGQWPAVARLVNTASVGRQILKMGLLTACAALFVVALARPQFGASERRLTRRGIDLIIAIDVSNSMLATDVPPTRLARAKEQLRELVMNSRGHRIGIVAFAGAAFAQCPLTLDYGLALTILDAIEVGIVPLQGTSIGAAIDAAVDAFERGEGGNGGKKASARPGERVLLLLTDGEDHDKTALEKAVERAARAGVRIYAIGIGSSEGAEITLPDGTIKKDAQGKVVTTRVDYETLERIAFRTNGVVIRGTATGDLDLIEARKHFDALEQTVQRSTTKIVYEERFVWVLALALLLLVWEMLQGDRKKELGL